MFKTSTTDHSLPLVAALALLALLFAPSRADAGAWAQEDKGLYAKLTGAWSTAGAQYKETGDTFRLLSEDEEGSYTSRALLMYAEFGLLPKLTATMSTSLMWGTIESDLIKVDTRGMTDLRTGLKYQFVDKPFVMSAASQVTIPTGYTPDPPTVKTPTLGLGVPAWEGTLLAGKSFYPVPLYASGQFGFRYRGARTSRNGDTVDYPPELPYMLEVGVNATDWLLARAVLNGVIGLGDPQEITAFSLSPTTQSYTKIGPSLIFNLGDSIQLNVDYLYTIDGINAVKSHDIMVGFAVDTVFQSDSD